MVSLMRAEEPVSSQMLALAEAMATLPSRAIWISRLVKMRQSVLDRDGQTPGVSLVGAQPHDVLSGWTSYVSPVRRQQERRGSPADDSTP